MYGLFFDQSVIGEIGPEGGGRFGLLAYTPTRERDQYRPLISLNTRAHHDCFYCFYVFPVLFFSARWISGLHAPKRTCET